MLNRRTRAVLARFGEKDLESELALRKRERLAELDRERSRLAEDLTRLDRRMSRQSGAGSANRGDASGDTEPMRRATRAQMAKLRIRLVEELKKHPQGVAIGVLRKAVRATPLQIRLSLVRLRQEKMIRTRGDRRRTRYFAA